MKIVEIAKYRNGKIKDITVIGSGERIRNLAESFANRGFTITITHHNESIMLRAFNDFFL